MKYFGQFFYIMMIFLCFVVSAHHAQATTLEIEGEQIRLSNIVIPAEYKKEAQAMIQNWQKQHSNATASNIYPNRFGDLSAIVSSETEILQEVLLKTGYAYFRPSGFKTKHAKGFWEAEREAMTDKKHFWRNKNAPLPQDQITQNDLFQFQIIHGTVYEAVKRGSIIYINFSADWKNDFTIKLQYPATRQLTKHVPDLSDLAGQKIEVRGWLHQENGPMITTKNYDDLYLSLKNTEN